MEYLVRDLFNNINKALMFVDNRGAVELNNDCK